MKPRIARIAPPAAAACLLAATSVFAADDPWKPVSPPPVPPTTMEQVAPGPFKADWESLKQYQCPDWFRDAKLGIWAHWSAQCQPEDGDWYARNMYAEGSGQYKSHLQHYGHPSKEGFKDIDNLWHAENWNPDKLMQLYVKAGARYFVALANHHDNFDCYDSAYQPWNSVNIGPHKDIIGIWAKTARKYGLKFGVTNHSSHAWHWLQTAYGHDADGPLKGVNYDGYLTRADGKGQWWEGYDPQDLYTGVHIPPPGPDASLKEMKAWIDKTGHQWTTVPPDQAYIDKWWNRTADLINKYQPDLLYFDDTKLPLGQAGLNVAAHLYNSNAQLHGGKNQAVLNSKGLPDDLKGTMVLDIERGRSNKIEPRPWQTDTCIGNWHYQRSLFERHQYKTAQTVIQTLCDIVSKNGNLLLNIPLRGDGTIDDDESKVLQGMAAWIAVNGEAIYGTRPYSVYGEGAPDIKSAGNFNENKTRPYTAEDIRFTTKGDTLYAIALGWPTDGKLLIKTLAPGEHVGQVSNVELLGSTEKLKTTQDASGLTVNLPDQKPGDDAYVFKITGAMK